MVARDQDDIDLQTDQLSGKLGKLLLTCSRMTKCDCNVVSFNQTQLAKRLRKRLHTRCCGRRRSRPQYSNLCHRRLLRSRRQRPRRRGAAEHCNEVTPAHAGHGSSLRSRSTAAELATERLASPMACVPQSGFSDSWLHPAFRLALRAARAGYSRAACPSCTSCQMRDGVSGSSRGCTPNDCNAFATALAMTPPTEMMPPSPAPLAPSGLMVERCTSISTVRITGKSLAVGTR